MSSYLILSHHTSKDPPIHTLNTLIFQLVQLVHSTKTLGGCRCIGRSRPSWTWRSSSSPSSVAWIVRRPDWHKGLLELFSDTFPGWISATDSSIPERSRPWSTEGRRLDLGGQNTTGMDVETILLSTNS